MRGHYLTRHVGYRATPHLRRLRRQWSPMTESSLIIAHTAHTCATAERGDVRLWFPVVDATAARRYRSLVAMDVAAAGAPASTSSTTSRRRAVRHTLMPRCGELRARSRGSSRMKV